MGKEQEETANQDNLPDFACLEEIASELIRAASGAKQIAIAKLAQSELADVMAWMDDKVQEIADLREVNATLQALEEAITEGAAEDVVRENEEYNRGFVEALSTVLMFLHTEKWVLKNKKGKEARDGR